jgi:hypothetical protein
MLELIPGSSLGLRVESFSSTIQHAHYGNLFRWITDFVAVTSRQQTSAISKNWKSLTMNDRTNRAI